MIACNTASSACLRDARERYSPVPVVEVILPAVRRAVAATRNGRIGVIGTAATIASGAYHDAFAAARDTEVFGVACPRFVDFVERGVTSGRQVLGLAEGYLEPLQRAEVDTLVLGCTHYPMLSGLIQLAMGDNVTLVSSAEETAKDLLQGAHRTRFAETSRIRPGPTGVRGHRRSGGLHHVGRPLPGTRSGRCAAGPASRGRWKMISVAQTGHVLAMRVPGMASWTLCD